ncbi:MAG: transferase [Desulfatirhabdiaceae bacterium]
MKQIEHLVNRIAQRISINLRELNFDIQPYIRNTIPLSQLVKFYAFYGITPHHPLNFHFSHSSLAGSYFLGKSRVDHSILYKSDIRGDELKSKGDLFKFDAGVVPVHEDESIQIKDSFLIKTLVHNYSHDPESLEVFFINDSMSMHYANIHGSPSEGCFFQPFSTIDLTTAHDCVIGRFSYVQVGEMSHIEVEPGTIWIKNRSDFNFLYRYPREILNRYVQYQPGDGPPTGIFMNFIEERKPDFKHIYDVVNIEPSISIPKGTSLDRYAVIKRKTHIEENVLVAQRAYLENIWLGKGANAQENCYIINSRLEGYNVTAHGAKIIHANMGEKVFVGFNSFLRGSEDCPLTIGKNCIVMPHTIIDLQEPLNIPESHLVWGFISNSSDLKHQSMSLQAFSEIREGIVLGDMLFEGSGEKFVKGFQNRIQHILEANGAFYDGRSNRGHAQKNQKISFNTIQPYPEGDLMGLYPTIEIRP